MAKLKAWQRQFANFLGGAVHLKSTAYVINEGDALCRDAATGGLRPLTDPTADIFVGFASKYVEVPASDAPALSPNINAEYVRHEAVLCLPADGETFAKTDEGKKVYCADETSVTKTATNAGAFCGILVRVEPNGNLFVDPITAAK